MTLFPGRTLEELEAMNWPRLQRALAVREIKRLETLRIMHAQGGLKSSQIGPDDWAALGRHEEIMERYVEQHDE